MSENESLNMFGALDFLKRTAPQYAKAKAERVWLEQFRKSKKAILMKKAEGDGQKTAALQERDAYAHPEYQELLDALKIATEEEERLRWLMTASQETISAWQTMEATKRLEMKVIP